MGGYSHLLVLEEDKENEEIVVINEGGYIYMNNRGLEERVLQLPSVHYESKHKGRKMKVPICDYLGE
jgi:hypothetical protein